MVTEVINVSLSGTTVGAVSFNTQTGIGAFEYAPSFIKSGIEISPLKMPLSDRIYTFPNLGFSTYKGLPGLVADSLPDDFGNAVLNSWISSQGKSTTDITPLQRLQYTGKRGMGALEYSPSTKLKNLNASTDVNIDELVRIAQEMLDERENFNHSLPHNNGEDVEGMKALMSVGMSAGGARPKAVLAFDQNFKNARSGQATIPEGFTHYLMKFDGVTEHNTKKETFGDPTGFGAMEFCYYIMATSCGIDMMHCDLLHEGDRRHFITQRFDRIGNTKVHTQTLNGIAHIDYKQPGTFSYTELLAVARQLKLPFSDAEQILRRMVFNFVARNHDDHSKNFSFVMQGNKWALSPAYDLAYSYKPGSKWINSHWLSLNGKRDNFTRDDIYTLSNLFPTFTKKKIDAIVDEVVEAVSQWERIAKDYMVPRSLIKEIKQNLRLYI